MRMHELQSAAKTRQTNGGNGRRLRGVVVKAVAVGFLIGGHLGITNRSYHDGITEGRREMWAHNQADIARLSVALNHDNIMSMLQEGKHRKVRSAGTDRTR